MTGKKRKKSVADAYLDKFRAKARAQRQPPPPAGTGKVKRDWVLILFLVFWLLGWSMGMLVATAFVLDGAGGWFMIAWLFVALIGWLFAWRQLYLELRGKPAGTGDDS